MQGFDIFGSPGRARTADLVINSPFISITYNATQQTITSKSIDYS